MATDRKTGGCAAGYYACGATSFIFLAGGPARKEKLAVLRASAAPALFS